MIKNWLNITLKCLIINILTIKERNYLNVRKTIYIKLVNHFVYFNYSIIRDV